MRRRALLAAAAILAFAAPRAVAAQPLQPTLERVTAAWQKGDVAVITALAARNGLDIDIDGGKVGPVTGRQATAMLRRAFDDRESVSARINMAHEVGGQPPRAFAEITWFSRTRGTTIPEKASVFISFVREDSAWRVTEIRLLR